MILAVTATVVLVITTILLLYETLRLTSSHLSELPLPPRARIIVVVLAAFIGHTLAVWTYAFGYWLLANKLGGFGGLLVEDFFDYLYFSAVTYTSLGFGDHVPLGHLRLIAGVEALNGLLLISWSASFTYLAMERYWPMHELRRGRARRGAHHAAHAAKAPAREHHELG
jgi:hypothetical protein